MSEQENEKITNFLFEMGTVRKLPRMHRQSLLTNDDSDNIASHTFRVAIIAWILAKRESSDLYKTLMMALLHDTKEARSGDHNWIHKRYAKLYEDEIINAQMGELPFSDFKEIVNEFQNRESKEAIIAKDADLLDEVLLLREYEWQGNKEAQIWLRGKSGEKQNKQLKKLQTESAQNLGKQILEQNPSDWWDNLWTPKNR